MARPARIPLLHALLAVGVSVALAAACSGPLSTSGPVSTNSPSPSMTATPVTTASVEPTPSSPTIGTVTPLMTFVTGGAGFTLLEADGAVWLFDWTTVRRIDPNTNDVTVFDAQDQDGAERPPALGTVGFGSLWVSDFDLSRVRRYDAQTGELLATIMTPSPSGLVATDEAVWVADHRTGTVSRVDPELNEVMATIEVGRSGRSGPDRLFWARGLIWVGIPNSRSVAAVDPLTEQVSANIKVEAPAVPCGDIASYGDRLFVSSCASAPAMGVVDMQGLAFIGSVAFEGNVTAPAAVGDQLWVGVAKTGASALTPFDPNSLEVGAGIPITGGFPTLVLSAFDSLWVVIESGDEAKPAALLRLPLAPFE